LNECCEGFLSREHKDYENNRHGSYR